MILLDNLQVVELKYFILFSGLGLSRVGLVNLSTAHLFGDLHVGGSVILFASSAFV